jgi:hypothetical protein
MVNFRSLQYQKPLGFPPGVQPQWCGHPPHLTLGSGLFRGSSCFVFLSKLIHKWWDVKKS